MSPGAPARTANSSLLVQVQTARAAAQRTATLPTEVRDAALEAMATALLEQQEAILAANREDLERAAEQVKRGSCRLRPMPA